MKAEMKEKMKHSKKLCTYVFNPVCGAIIKTDMCSAYGNHNLVLKTGHEYLARVKFYYHGQIVKEDICEFKNIKLYPDATIHFTLKLDGSTNRINIDINPGTKEYSILDIVEESDLDATVDVYDCTPKAEEDAKETASDKDEKPNFTSEVDPHLRDKEYQAALMAELFKQKLASCGLSIVDKDGSPVNIDDCLASEEPWKTFQTTAVEYEKDGSIDADGISEVDEDEIDKQIIELMQEVKDTQKRVKRLLSKNRSLIRKMEALKTTTDYPHVLNSNSHCIKTTDDIMVRVELREKVSHVTFACGDLYFRREDVYGYRMIFGEAGKYEIKLIDKDFVKEHPQVPYSHCLYVDTAQIPNNVRDNLEMVVTELVDRHIHPYDKDFMEYMHVVQAWLNEAYDNIKGSKRARKQIIKLLED